jgi:hypothetical protein
MTHLEHFLHHNVEGYLFHDLREMQRVLVGYPLLMTTFAGIELLGALLSPSRFNKGVAWRYFGSYWETYLYPEVKNTNKIGEVLYQLVRHGIAHNFVLKGPIAVIRWQPPNHLTRDPEGVIYVDAVELANDFIESFTTRVKALVASKAGEVNSVTMAARLEEMETEYGDQATKLLVTQVFPLATVATTAAVSHSIAPTPDR